jgi:hypothetical protein
MPREKKTMAELVEVLDDGTTLADILIGFGWYKNELKRSADKGKKYREAKKAKKSTATTTGPGDEDSGSPNLSK